MHRTSVLSKSSGVRLMCVLPGNATAVERMFQRIKEWAQSEEDVDIETISAEVLRRRLSTSDEIPPPEFVVILQNWPDEFSHADVGMFLGRWPLARWICCYGPWCESDGRTRNAWPLAVRTPRSQALERLVREAAVVRRKSPPLPVTASREEAFARDYRTELSDSIAPPALPAVNLQIVTSDRVYGESLRVLLQHTGLTVNWSRPVDWAEGLPVGTKPPAPKIILWDDAPGTRPMLAACIDRASTPSRSTRFVLLTDAPGDEETILSSMFPGIDAAIPKLAPASLMYQRLSDLATQLDGVAYSD